MKRRIGVKPKRPGLLRRPITNFGAIEKSRLSQGFIRMGQQQGRQSGMIEMILELLRKAHGTVGNAEQRRIHKLPHDTLVSLGLAAGSMKQPADLKRWLAKH